MLFDRDISGMQLSMIMMKTESVRAAVSSIGRTIIVLGAMAFTSGCDHGRSEIPRRLVEGTVSAGGQPLPSGRIRFIPAADTPGPVTIALIAEGRYVADHRGGVPVGQHRVEIEGYRPRPGARPVSEDLARDFADLQAGEVPVEQFLSPEVTGATSQLKATVQSGRNPQTLNFALD